MAQSCSESGGKVWHSILEKKEKREEAGNLASVVKDSMNVRLHRALGLSSHSWL